MKLLEQKLGYTFQDSTLLEHALTHSSHANESKGKLRSNERLEFLGDSILGMVVADYLYRTYENLPEGELTRIRANLVCEEGLFTVAQELGLGEHLKLGKGEAAGGGKERPSILADAVEALFAAVYLDGGIGSVRKIITKFVLSKEEDAHKTASDYKTLLQEVAQQEAGRVLHYQLTGEEGPDHNKVFYVSVFLNETQIGTGQGRSKKDAEQMAAKMGLAQFQERKIK